MSSGPTVFFFFGIVAVIQFRVHPVLGEDQSTIFFVKYYFYESVKNHT